TPMTASADALQHEGTIDAELEAASARARDAHGRIALLESALQEDEPALEVVAERWQLQRRIEPGLPVGERCPARGGVFARDLPEEPAGNALDHIGVVEERAPVDHVVAESGRGDGRRQLGRS